jgi:hypothetical protein
VISIGLVIAGCATSPYRRSVLGRAVEVDRTNGDTGGPVKGELLAVSPEKLWVMGPQAVRSVPRSEIREVRVRQHGLTGRKATHWLIIGALVSGTALTLSCSSVEGNENCGKVLIPVLVSWGALGIPSAMGFAESSQLRVKPSSWETLRPYARFPQGLPNGVDPASLDQEPSPGGGLGPKP